MSNPKIAIIIGSTRESRFGTKPAQWLFDIASQRQDLDFEIVDLKQFDLPFFNENASNLWMPSQDPKAIAWQQKIGEFDGYIVVAAEYNRSLTGAMKNAFDQAYNEWNRKPLGFLGYGVVGAARAIEHGRAIGIELQMVNLRTAVHISGGEFYKVVPGAGNQPISTIEDAILPSANNMLDEMAWWARATMAARAGTAL
jgi:NAD(P)H-dependent FMN reductase